MNTDRTNLKNVKKEAAVCGLFCSSCSIYIASKEDPERLKAIAENYNVNVDRMKCEGCRSNKRIGYCEACRIFRCASEKGIEFCGECDEYPCDEIKKFQSILPHRLELWKSQKRIQEAGWQQWYSEMLDHYSCPRCGTINSAYDAACRKCGHVPSCEYVEVNGEEIKKRMPDFKKFSDELGKTLKDS